MLAATLLALGSAALHASWNLLIKTSDERFLTAWGQMLFGGLLFLPLLAVTGVPASRALAIMAVSLCVHTAYVLSLVRAYDHGDFSFSYPIARGAGALLAALGGALFLGDGLSPAAWLSIGVVFAGLLSLVNRQVSKAAIGWALFTAATIGTYTTFDAAGARQSSGFGYVALLITGLGLSLTAVGAARGLVPAFVRYARADWRRLSFAGLAGILAYSMVMVGMRLAPVGYVAALRESSVILGALGGWLLLREPLGPRRVVSAAVVAAGLICLVTFG